MRFPWQRSRARAAMLAALAGLVAVVTATLLGSLAFVGARSAAVSAAELRAADGAAGVLVLQTRLDADPAGQQDAWESLLRTEAGDAVASVTTLMGEPLTLTSPDGAFPPGRTSLAQVDWLREHADLVEGEWADQAGLAGGGASGPIPGTIPAASAAELEIGVGDLLLLGRAGDTAVEIVGLWTPREPDDPRWVAFASSDVSGSAASTGPVVVEDVNVAGGRPFVRWSVVGSGASLDLAALATASDGVTRLAGTLGDDEAIAPQGVTSAGELAATLTTLRVAADAARVVCGVALVLLGVIGAVTISQVARLVAQARDGETAILAARGAAPRHLHGLVWSEAVVLAVVGTGVGTAVGAALGAGFGAHPSLMAIPVLPALLAVGWAVVVGLPGASALRGRHDADRSGRGRSLAATGVALLLLLAAGVSLWRFSTTFAGPPQDRTALDQVVAVVAPGLLTLALAVLALVLLVPLWGLLDRVAPRVRRLGTTLALRSVARRRAVLSVPLLLLVTAVATSVVGAGYAGSTTAARTLVEDTRVGADARLERSGSSVVTGILPGRTLAPVLEIDGVTGAALAQRVAARAGEVDVVVEAVPAAGATEVLRGGTTSAADLAAAIRPAPATTISGGDVVVTASLGWADGASGPPEGLPAPGALDGTLGGVLWLASPAGEIQRLELTPGTFPDIGESAGTMAAVPAGEWTLLGVDVTASGAALAGWGGLLELVLDGVTASGSELDLPWRHLAADGVGSGTRVPGSWTASDLTARFTPPATGRLPAVVTTALATQLAVGPGDPVSLALRGATFDAEVVVVTDLLPGALDAPAALVDLTALQRAEAQQRRPVTDALEVWVALADGEAGERALASLRDLVRDEGGSVSVSGAGASAGTAVAQPVFLAVAGVATLLAVIGTLAAVDVLTRSRRGEVVTLRAVGVPGRVQGGSRLLETVVLGAAAIPVGLAVGWVVAATTMPTLVQLSVAGLASSSAELRIAATELVAGLALAALGVLAAGLLSARRVRAQHADTEHREETR